jgi:hypothetical protein
MNRLASSASRSSVIVDLLQCFKRLIAEKDLSQFDSVMVHNLVEMERWKMFCAGLQKQDSNQSLEEAIELTDPIIRICMLFLGFCSQCL